MPTASHRTVVYTAITDAYDDLKEQPHRRANQAEFVAFLDEPRESQTWRTYPIHTAFADPTRNAKIHKILSHRYFPAADYTLWIDGSVTIRADRPLQRLIDTCLAECDVAVFRHRMRTCVYQEASVCVERQLDDPEVIWQQICRYTAAGFPPNAGLGECCVILRRHSPAVRAFNEAWWEEIAHGSRRDQLSFDYIASTLGLRYAVFDGTIADNPWFRRAPHTVPRVVTVDAPPADAAQ
ncbi:MAG: glycosyltransferase domain-containing protein, partial [Candidatus Binatia bacterium]